MMTRFVVISDAETRKTRDAITEAIRAEHVGWWHWIGSAWLIADPKGRDVTWWRDRLMEATERTEPAFIVLDSTSSDDWAAFAPERWGRWIKKEWHNERKA